MPKNEAAKKWGSFFTVAILQMWNSQKTDAISETAVFIKFQWMQIDMKNEFIKEQEAKPERRHHA